MTDAPVATEQSHTPGPWKTFDEVGIATVRAYISPGTDLVTQERGVAICDEFNFVGSASNVTKPLEEQRANARLIAAAPELLQALKEVVALSDRKHDAWDAAHAAIAKAEGRL